MEIDVVKLSIKLAGLVLYAFLGAMAFVTKWRSASQGRGTSRSVGILYSFMAIGFAVSAAAEIVPDKDMRLALLLVSFGFFATAVVVGLASKRRARRVPGAPPLNR